MKTNITKLFPPATLDDESRGTNHWAMLAGKLGAAPSLPRPFLIGIRGADVRDGWPKESHETLAAPKYDDCAVLLIRGHLPYVFPFSSHPYQRNSKAATDGNGDGVPDVACIRAVHFDRGYIRVNDEGDSGCYVLTRATTRPFPIFTVATEAGNARIPCFRDLNHDGAYSAEEMAKHLEATAILWHLGYDAPAGSEHRSSIGCQTSSLRWLQIMAQHPVIDYRLVNAWDLVTLVETNESGNVA